MPVWRVTTLQQSDPVGEVDVEVASVTPHHLVSRRAAATKRVCGRIADPEIGFDLGQAHRDATFGKSRITSFPSRSRATVAVARW